MPAAQTQKEFFINEALARIDALLHPQIEGQANTPPPQPAEGDCWIIGPEPVGEWQGGAGRLACHLAGAWHLVAPTDGMRVFDRHAGRFRLYDGGWLTAATVALPSGGGTVDAEARAAIAGIIAALTAARIIG